MARKRARRHRAWRRLAFIYLALWAAIFLVWSFEEMSGATAGEPVNYAKAGLVVFGIVGIVGFWLGGRWGGAAVVALCVAIIATSFATFYFFGHVLIIILVAQSPIAFVIAALMGGR